MNIGKQRVCGRAEALGSGLRQAVADDRIGAAFLANTISPGSRLTRDVFVLGNCSVFWMPIHERSRIMGVPRDDIINYNITTTYHIM